MATACAVYKGGVKLGTGTAAAGSVTISSYTATSGLSAHAVALRRNVEIQMTAGDNVGKSWRARCTAEGATLTLDKACPFVGA